MTHNYLISCNICKIRINLRAQIGYFNIPFNLHCPECNTHIHGKVIINQEEISITLNLENAQIDDREINSKEEYYCAELSAEFPTNKMYERKLGNYDLPPFIRNSMFYEDSAKSIEATKTAMLFATHFKERWKEFKIYYELFWNNQYSLLYPKLEKEIQNYEFITVSRVTNKLSASMALHQLFMTTTGLTSALEPETLNEYINISKLIIQSNLEEVQKFAHSISSEFDNIQRKAFKLIDSFLAIYEQLIPIVALRNSQCLNNVDRKQYGIMTANFEELSDFYAKSYEWILDNINIIIALNNIYSRNCYTLCSNNKPYDSILKIGSKYNKLEYINSSEPFSTPTNSLQNHIRNAIQHFDADINYISQNIIFTDNYRGKTKQDSMYLIDFADLCVENFSIIIYILELTYNIRRVFHISNGLTPNLAPQKTKFYSEVKNKKIGRNDPCVCGSGKKYKRCCL